VPNKINLITPPDTLHNKNYSLSLINISQEEKETCSIFLSRQKDEREINLYSYNKENNPTWLLNRVDGKINTYINLDNTHDISVKYTSYILSMSNVFYSTTDTSTKDIYSLINANYVTDIQQFLDKVYND
jgi:hypothetical protein